jgi:hypothetical protein
MRLGLDPLDVAPWHLTAESIALAAWYDSHPVVRRLWGIKTLQLLRVIVSVEATHDNSDIFPLWLGHSGNWLQELELGTGRAVQLELFEEGPFDGIHVEAGSVVIADLFWRDSTLISPAAV